MKHWVTSDTHFGHANILTYCPWRATWAASIEEHDRALIEAWNVTVAPGDVVYHLGDFALVKRAMLTELRMALNGEIVLMLGNHDRSATAMRDAGFQVRKVQEIEVPVGQLEVPIAYLEATPAVVYVRKLVMRHDPSDFTTDECERASLLLHGHWHGNDQRHASDVPGSEFRYKLVDVGIDARREIAPANFVQLVQGVLALRP